MLDGRIGCMTFSAASTRGRRPFQAIQSGLAGARGPARGGAALE
jgi:hypothetical protein